MILVPTDLSPEGNHAAQYALHLAKVLKCNLKLCHATSTGLAAGVDEEPDIDRKLFLLSEKLVRDDRQIQHNAGYHPLVNFVSEIGPLTEIVNAVVAEDRIPLVVMSASDKGSISHFLQGSNTHDMIDEARFPLLLVPSKTHFRDLKKIAFATDLNEKDVQIICSVASLARSFNADILLIHITDERSENSVHGKHVENFLKEIADKVNYPKIYYRHIKSIDVEQGLDWVCEQGGADMLAMAHGQHNLVDKAISGSHTQKVARELKIPLLIYPKHVRSASLTVF